MNENKPAEKTSIQSQENLYFDMLKCYKETQDISYVEYVFDERIKNNLELYADRGECYKDTFLTLVDTYLSQYPRLFQSTIDNL